MSAASALSPHFRTRSGRRASRRPLENRAAAGDGSGWLLPNQHSYEMADPLQTIVASWVLSLSASEEGSGA